ncbi:MAG TPA: hypothetical protein PKZ32_20040 [Candidatus Melainabacteria bacterium]|nr:hypothetical protein [Candidatus Melainabacteria bacterium]
MRKFSLFILLALLLTFPLFGCETVQENPSVSKEHHEIDYVPWGIDEFELFGLAKNEIGAKSKGELQFKEEDSSAEWKDGRSAHFQVSFDKDGKITSVQRVFVDGAGCLMRGPLFTSRKQALEFSVAGLSKRDHLDQAEKEKLSTAKALLAEQSN